MLIITQLKLLFVISYKVDGSFMGMGIFTILGKIIYLFIFQIDLLYKSKKIF